MYECPTCSKPTSSPKTCRNCNGKLSPYWLDVLARLDKDLVAAEKRSQKELCFSHYTRVVGSRELDGWDLIYEGHDFREFDDDEMNVQFFVRELLPLIPKTGVLTKSEFNALSVRFSMPNPSAASDEDLAIALSRLERKPVSVEACRQRLSSLRKKLDLAVLMAEDLFYSVVDYTTG